MAIFGSLSWAVTRCDTRIGSLAPSAPFFSPMAGGVEPGGPGHAPEKIRIRGEAVTSFHK